MSWLPEPLQELLQQLIKHLPHDLQAAAASSPEGLVIAAVLSVLLGLLLLLAFSSVAGGRRRGSTVVLAGPVNSGKSSLFFQIRDGSMHNGLVASMQENSGLCSLPSGKRCRLLDIPGHHSFRHRLEASLRDAAAVVFVVDAVEVSPRRVEAAEMLYELLNNPSFHQQRLPLLLACNKSDLEEDAHSVEFIRKTLEKQLNELRSSKSVGIGKDAAAQSTAMGPTDKPFSFDRLRSKVLLAECSATAGNLSAVTTFISSCV